MRDGCWYLTSDALACVAVVEHGYVVGGSPIIRKFAAQRAEFLEAWMRRQGNLVVEPATPEWARLRFRVTRA